MYKYLVEEKEKKTFCSSLKNLTCNGGVKLCIFLAAFWNRVFMRYPSVVNKDAVIYIESYVRNTVIRMLCHA